MIVWWPVWCSRWNKNWQGKPKYSEKRCLSAAFSTTNSTWSDLGSNPVRRLSYGNAPLLFYFRKSAESGVTKVMQCPVRTLRHMERRSLNLKFGYETAFSSLSLQLSHWDPCHAARVGVVFRRHASLKSCWILHSGIIFWEKLLPWWHEHCMGI
jgi:hypothetical protein